MSSFRDVVWVIQENLGDPKYIDGLKRTLEYNSMKFHLVKVLPFVNSLPNIPVNSPTVFYGATGFIDKVHSSGMWRPGVWFNETNFLYSTFIKEYGSLALNDKCSMVRIRDFKPEDVKYEEYVFIRPNKDLKEFTGQVIKVEEFNNWMSKLQTNNGEYIDQDTVIVIAKPWTIQNEWRLFVVDKKIVTGSRYKLSGKINYDSNLPGKVVGFAEAAIRQYAPAPVFVMDICECGGELYLLENNCFHSSGFYVSNISEIVKHVSSYAAKEYQ